jgi:hypothetical protein
MAGPIGAAEAGEVLAVQMMQVCSDPVAQYDHADAGHRHRLAVFVFGAVKELRIAEGSVEVAEGPNGSLGIVADLEGVAEQARPGHLARRQAIGGGRGPEGRSLCGGKAGGGRACSSRPDLDPQVMVLI